MARSGIDGISNWRQPHAPAGLPALGRLQTVKALPRSVAGMADDLRRSGAIAKDLTRYAEFLWADHLRVRLKASLIAQDHDKAMARALTLVRAPAAAYLPGWCGIDA